MQGYWTLWWQSPQAPKPTRAKASTAIASLVQRLGLRWRRAARVEGRSGINVYKHTYVYIYIYACTYMYTYIHIFQICIYVYIYTHRERERERERERGRGGERESWNMEFCSVALLFAVFQLTLPSFAPQLAKGAAAEGVQVTLRVQVPKDRVCTPNHD